MLGDVVEEAGETTEVLGHTLKILRETADSLGPLGFRSSLCIWRIGGARVALKKSTENDPTWGPNPNLSKLFMSTYIRIQIYTNMYSNNCRNIWCLASGSCWVNSLNMGQPWYDHPLTWEFDHGIIDFCYLDLLCDW